MMDKSAKGTVKRRTLLTKQPARALLVDTSLPYEQDVVTLLCESLDNLFAMACTSAGPTRVPLASILLLSTYPEILMPLSYIKGNLARIQGAVCDLKTRLIESRTQERGEAGCIGKGVLDALRSYVSQLSTMSQPSSSFYQLEIVILSRQSTEVIIKQIESVNSLIDIQHLKKILIVSVAVDNEDLNVSGSPATPSSNTSSPLPITGLIDTHVLENDPLSFQNLFYWWLTNESSDSEHLHLVFPSSTSDDDGLTIKCDLFERILSPAQLPYNEFFTLHPDTASCKPVFPSTSKACGMTVPIHRIQIINLLPSSSICESVVFGMPMIVQATTCWKIDWDELDKNQNNFRALCHLLLTKDLVMLGKLAMDTSSNNGNQIENCPMPRGSFLMLPAPNNTLLIKSIAVRELILPFRDRQPSEDIPEENLSTMQACLSQIDINARFNPLQQDSGLFDCLKFKAKPNNTQNRQQKRKSSKSWATPSSPIKITPGDQMAVVSCSSNQLEFCNRQGWRKSSFLTHLE